MIAPEIIDRVREATDIVQVVSQFLPLKKAGANYKGLCPFHGEKTPSFTVHQGKQIFHCFGCGEGGNVFHFLMKAGKRSFVEAVEELAEKAGIVLPRQERDDEETARKAKQRERLLELLELTTAWFFRNLRDSGEAAPARAYAETRGLAPATVDRFRIGFSPDNGQALLKAAAQKGYQEKDLIEAGLASQGERGVYCRFRGRLMFPIENAAGKVVGFGGRLMGPGEPKYLNSPETPVFAKGQLLFALPQAKEGIARRGQVLVVEGYMDAVACHQAGVDFCVASLGTALGESHARQLKRYTEEVVLFFDSDRAGIQAAQRGCEVLLAAGLKVKVVRLAGAKDPDEFLRSKGRDEFLQLLDGALEPPDFFLENGLAGETGKPSLSRRVAVAQSLFPLLAKYPTQMEADSYLRLVSDRLELAEDAVRSDFEAFRQGKAQKALQSARVSREEGGKPAAAPALSAVEREVLGLLVEHPECLPIAQALLPEPEFSDPLAQAAAQLLWSNPGLPLVELESKIQEDDSGLRGFLTGLSLQPAKYGPEPGVVLDDLLRKLRQERLRYKRKLASQRLAGMDTKADAQRTRELLAEIHGYDKEIQELKKSE